MSDIELGGRRYAIRPAGVLGPRERRELVAARRRCEELEQRGSSLTPIEARGYLADMRQVTQLAVAGIPRRVLRDLRRAELAEVWRTFIEATRTDVKDAVERSNSPVAKDLLDQAEALRRAGGATW